tara:strand:+ start:4601 stop:6109 length:1509 start_codon:yes stop_codon:yes gene_type:complete
MAISIEQYPVDSSVKTPVITNWNPQIGYMILADDDNTNFFYQKIILEVRLDDISGALIAKMKQRGNGFSSDIVNNQIRAFFDLKEIANTQMVDTYYDQNCGGAPFNSIHTLGSKVVSGTSTIFSRNGNAQQGKAQVVKLHIIGGQEYSTAVGDSPVETIIPGALNQDTKIYLRATLDLFEPRFLNIVGSVDTDYIQGAAFRDFKINTSTNRFLSDVQKTSYSTGSTTITNKYINFINSNDDGTEGDWHTLAFLNDNANFNSQGQRVQYKFYEADGSQIGSTVVVNNVAANGGETPLSVTLTNAQRLLYLAAGPRNLAAITNVNTSLNPSNFANWNYYTIQMTNTSGDPKSEEYYFIRKTNCGVFKKRRLGWLNSVGGYDYFNFNLKSVQTLEVTRNNFDKMLGTFNKSKYRYDDTDRGKTTRETTAVLKETLQTDYITEAEAHIIEKLLVSTRVDILSNTDTEYTEGVMITDSSFIRKTVINDRLIQYTINIEYANNINTNS